MGDADAALCKTAADEQAAMAGQRFMLGTHQRRPRARRHFFNPREALGEERAGRHVFIVGNAAASWAPAEFEAQEHVTDAGGVETLL